MTATQTATQTATKIRQHLSASEGTAAYAVFNSYVETAPSELGMRQRQGRLRRLGLFVCGASIMDAYTVKGEAMIVRFGTTVAAFCGGR